MNPDIESEGFVIDSDQKAEWALRKISEYRAEGMRMADVCDAEITRYEQIKAEAQDKCDRECSYLESLLYTYFGMVEHKKTKTQETYKLPSGTLRLKAQEPQYERKDDAIIAWAQGQKLDNLVKEKPVLDWKELKGGIAINGEDAIYTATGEIVPGIKVIPRDPKFVVEA